MKLEQINIQGSLERQPIHLDGFSNGLTFVYGENSAGKSTVNRFFRDSILSQRHDSNHVADQALAGQVFVNRAGHRYELTRPTSSGSSTLEASANVSPEIFDTVFNVSMRNTPNNARRLAVTLQQQLGVPVGPEAAGDESGQLVRQQQIESLRVQLTQIDLDISGLERKRSEHAAHASAKIELQKQLSSVDLQIATLQNRIGEQNSAPLSEQLIRIGNEMESLRLRIDNAQAEVIYPVAEKRPSGDHVSLYQRLDELENQIRRWRHVQTDVQEQRVRLRDEMLIWNELTLDSDEHPYHTAREILVSLESRVDQAERNANHWADVGDARVDTEQMVGSLGQICQDMREDVYRLCNELAHQYKHLRHKAAATELKQLRRCYTEMAENIERLVNRRSSVIKEIHHFDPAGAEAIVRSEAGFCQCAQHDGYLEARKRFVGPVAAPVAPQPVRIEPDLSHERARLTVLEAEKNDVRNRLSRFDVELTELNRQLAELLRERDALVARLGSFGGSELSSIDAKLSSLHEQRRVIQVQMERQPVAVVNPILQQASSWLLHVTGGQLQRVFIKSNLVSNSIELGLHDQLGQDVAFETLEPGCQDQVYLCVMMAAKDHLRQSRSIELPTMIDDSFCRISGDRINATLQFLDSVCRNDHQVILFSQHRYLSDRLPGIRVLEIGSAAITPQPQPQVYETRQSINVAPVVRQQPQFETRADTSYRDQISNAQVSQASSAPYPLSKYRRNDEVLVDVPAESPRLYPMSRDESHGSSIRSYSPPASQFSAVPVNEFAQPVSLSARSESSPSSRSQSIGAMDASTPLESVGMFVIEDLRFMNEHRVFTLGDLLSIDDQTADRLGFGDEQIEEWQIQALLLCAVPTLTIAEARTIAACGITSPKQMVALHARELYDRVQRLLNSNHDQSSGFIRVINFDRVQQWISDLDRTRSRWQGRRRSDRRRSSSRSMQPRDGRSRDYRDRDRDRDARDRDSRERDARSSRERNGYDSRSPRPPRMHTESSSRDQRDYRRRNSDRPERGPRPERTSRRERESVAAPAIAPARATVVKEERDNRSSKSTPSKSRSSSKSKLKFYLNLDDHIEAAPSIGPKTAERFEKIGVVTVQEFLKQTAESMADKLDYKRITSEIIRQWQHQARLICRVPNLRGHDVQLLVGCEIIEPETLATMQPQRLFEKIKPFAESKDGLKIIRNGKKPDLAEITDWITWAADTRSIQAA